MNKLGGGIVEPNIKFSQEKTSILSNVYKKRIDLKTAAKNEQDLCHIVRQDRNKNKEKKEILKGCSDEKPKIFKDKLHTNRIIDMQDTERQISRNSRSMRSEINKMKWRTTNKLPPSLNQSMCSSYFDPSKKGYESSTMKFYMS